MNLKAALLTLIAPVPFWLLGLPWLVKNELRRVRMAPLLGCALAGFYAELALVLGLPVRAFVGVLTLASVGFLMCGRRETPNLTLAALTEWLPIYLLAVLAASLSPFPVLGSWDGDWLLLYQMGQSVIHGGLAGNMLARPPLFGAAAAPLWLFSDGLIPYQLMAAVASAAAATVMFSFIEFFRPASPRIALLPFLLSPFFLHNAAAAWGKPLAAGLILAAAIEGLSSRRWASAAFFALSVAVHEGSIIWAPCILLTHAASSRGWRGISRAVLPFLAMGIVVVAPLQIWILARFGLAAKVAANPVIAESGKSPFLHKTILAVLSTFVGWGPLANVVRWVNNPHPTASTVITKEGYWLITSWITTLAGTLAGLLFPFVFIRRALVTLLSAWRLMGKWTLTGLGFAVLMNALLSPFYGNEGMLQVGLVPLAYGLYGVLITDFSSLGDECGHTVRRMSWLMGIAGTLPWFLANAGTSAGLLLSATFRERIRTGSEGDYFRVVKNGLNSLGMTTFPTVPLLCGVLLVLCLLYRHRQTTGDSE